MYRYRIELSCYKDVVNFVNITSKVKHKVSIKSGNYCVNAKSILNVLASMEWGDLLCESENDIYHLIERYIVGESI